MPCLIKAIAKRDSVDDSVIEDSPEVDRPFINGNSNMIAVIKNKTALYTVTLKTLFLCRQFNNPATMNRPEASRCLFVQTR